MKIARALSRRGMILGRHSHLVKFAGELLRRQVNRGEALLFQSNRRRDKREEERERERSGTEKKRRRNSATCPCSFRRFGK